MQSGAEVTQGTYFKLTTGASIIVPIVSIHPEHVVTYITEVLRVTI